LKAFLIISNPDDAEHAIKLVLEKKSQELKKLLNDKKKLFIDRGYIMKTKTNGTRYIAPEYMQSLILKNYEWLIEEIQKDMKRIPDIIRNSVMKKKYMCYNLALPADLLNKLDYKIENIPERILKE
jgi:hypothetical protein